MEFLECCAMGCMSNDSTPGITFMRLPDNTEQLQYVLTSIDRPDLLSMSRDKLLENHFVCSIHFDSGQGETSMEVMGVVSSTNDEDCEPTQNYQTAVNSDLNVNQGEDQSCHPPISGGSNVNGEFVRMPDSDSQLDQRHVGMSNSSDNHYQQPLSNQGFKMGDGDIKPSFNINSQEYRSVIGGQTGTRVDEIRSLQTNESLQFRILNYNARDKRHINYSQQDRSHHTINNENGNHTLEKTTALIQAEENGHENYSLPCTSHNNSLNGTSHNNSLNGTLQNEDKQKEVDLIICHKCGKLFSSIPHFHEHLVSTGEMDTEELIGRVTNKETDTPVIERNLSYQTASYISVPSKNANHRRKVKDPHSCNLCLEKCNNGKGLHKHMMTYHRDCYCPRCSKCFKSKYYLQTHQAHHCHMLER